MDWTVACNLASYGPYRARAYAHLDAIGLRYIEIPCPEPKELDAVRKDLSAHGLSVSTVTVPCQMDADDVVPRFAHALDTAKELGVTRVFTSAKSAELDLDYVYGRLQGIGDAAAERGLIVALETHPDLITNADRALETMAGVAHPNVRVNFDTANLYYYNEQTDVLAELRRLVRFVTSVHLKDTNGAYQTWHFPALGEGMIDFGGVFDVLREAGYDGPLTLEIEGVEGEVFSLEGAQARVEASLAHLEALGVSWRD